VPGSSPQQPKADPCISKLLRPASQIYDCSQKPDSSYESAFKAPEASFADPAGHSLGKHYAGPTWESGDGRIVVGDVKAKNPGPSPSAIP
jgi:hypothetical protein